MREAALFPQGCFMCFSDAPGPSALHGLLGDPRASQGVGETFGWENLS